MAHARPGSQIGLGLKPGATHDQFEQAIHEKRAEDLLNWIDVHQGDMIYVAGATVHTLGPGSVIVETQQQSDTTYRLYDYGRPRPLHLERGLASVKERVASGKVAPSAPRTLDGGKNRQISMIAAPYFVVDLLELRELQEFSTTDESGKTSAQILVATNGFAMVEAKSCPPTMLAKGDAVVIPAALPAFSVHPQTSIDFLKAFVPSKRINEPTLLP